MDAAPAQCRKLFLREAALRLVNFDYDLAIVGGGFAGLSAAATAAARDLRVAVLEAKPRCGAKVHTTGILVKEAAEVLDFPPVLTRKIHGVRLYAPNLHHIDLKAPGYYFAATDTDALLDWMAMRARIAGATIFTGMRLRGAKIRDGFVELEPAGIRAKFVIGADGPKSAVARLFELGRNRRFLTGVEAEFAFIDQDDDFLHCFLDSELAPGYLGWMVPGVGVRQIGLAAAGKRKPDLERFRRRIEPITGGMEESPREIRGGIIPCGGRVAPFANQHVLLVGDAAGLVSPLTGGGIHRALQLGRNAALAVCSYLQDGGPHPGLEMAREYPSFAGKSLLRRLIGLNPPNRLYNALLGTKAFEAFARTVFFNSRRVAARRQFSEVPETRLRSAA